MADFVGGFPALVGFLIKAAAEFVAFALCAAALMSSRMSLGLD